MGYLELYFEASIQVLFTVAAPQLLIGCLVAVVREVIDSFLAYSSCLDLIRLKLSWYPPPFGHA
jgi:NADH:ubiquinone oxidoreductase subunit 2 (subunit N)